MFLGNSVSVYLMPSSHVIYIYAVHNKVYIKNLIFIYPVWYLQVEL